jgi:PTH1 family peptidyl-tRNA hydrolase
VLTLIVGLGNPGLRYRQTRHNVGFRVIDELAARWMVALTSARHEAESGLGVVADASVMLAKPQTFMNLSGDAVGRLRRARRLKPEAIVAVYDDLDLPCGRVRIRTGGGAGGHNGVASLISVLGREFPRVRLGIGRPGPGEDPVDYVLGRFTGDEQGVIDRAVEHAADAVEAILREGLEAAMNAFNRRRPAVA